MRWETIQGIIERILLVGVTYAASKGWFTPEQGVEYVALVLGILGAIWGWWVNRPKALLVAAANLPQVKEVTLKPNQTELAAAVPSTKVDT